MSSTSRPPRRFLLGLGPGSSSASTFLFLVGVAKANVAGPCSRRSHLTGLFSSTADEVERPSNPSSCGAEPSPGSGVQGSLLSNSSTIVSCVHTCLRGEGLWSLASFDLTDDLADAALFFMRLRLAFPAIACRLFRLSIMAPPVATLKSRRMWQCRFTSSPFFLCNRPKLKRGNPTIFSKTSGVTLYKADRLWRRTPSRAA